MNFDKELANNLAETRRSLQISQKDAADSIGVKLNMYTNWERGVNAIPLAHLIAFCTVHHVYLDKIIPGYHAAENTDIGDSNISLLLDRLLESGSNPQIISQLKGEFMSLLEELSNEKEKVIEEKEKLAQVLKLIEERFKVKIGR